MKDEDDMPEEFSETEVDPIQVEEVESKIDDSIKDYAKRTFRIQDDEIATLFPNRSSLRSFAQDAMKLVKSQSMPGRKGKKEPEDSFELDKRELARISTQIRKRKAIKENAEKKLIAEGEKMLGEEPTVKPLPLKDLLSKFEDGDEEEV